jgi:hypothetical protein
VKVEHQKGRSDREEAVAERRDAAKLASGDAINASPSREHHNGLASGAAAYCSSGLG